MEEKIVEELNVSLFKSLLQNLLTTNVTVVDDNNSLTEFQEKHCIHEALLPMFTAVFLADTLDTMDEGTFYEIVDHLDICLFIFSFAGHKFLIGPYVHSIYDDNSAQAFLTKHQFREPFAISFKFYHTSLPVLNIYQIQHIVLSCIHSFSPLQREYSYKKLSELPTNTPPASIPVQSEMDYDIIYQRYHLENYFLSMITEGNVAGVSKAFRDMTSLSNYSYSSLAMAYQSPLTPVRILARTAAERSGLCVVIIDEITQRSVQKMAAAVGIPAQMKIMDEMLIELTTAVHEHLKRTSGYSPDIIKLIEYLSLNLSHDIPINSLCNIVGYSASQLSKVFKAETGKTISQYIAFLRCEQAANMLTSTNLPIADIGNYIGYPDNNYFVKVFKKQYTLTPSEYRKQNKKHLGIT